MRKINKLIGIIAVFFYMFTLILPTSVSATTSVELYISNTGSDTNDGSIGNPFKTLEKARDVVNTLKGSANDVTVYLRGGTYLINDTFSLKTSDSGSAQTPIVYCGYPNEKVVLTGGASLSKGNFTPLTDTALKNKIIDTNARDKIVKIDLYANGVTDLGETSRTGWWSNMSGKPAPPQLYINKELQTLSRWPNNSKVSMASVINKGSEGGSWDSGVGGTFSYNYDRPSLWQNKDIWVDGIFGYSWEWSFNKVENIDAQKKEITLKYRESSGIFKNWFEDFHYYVNVFEELDMQGEYYIDRESGIMYLYPNDSFNSGNPTITLTNMAKPIFKLENVSNVKIKDIEFSYGRDKAISVLGGNEVTIENCDINCFANDAVYLYGKDNKVINSKIYHIGGMGVDMSGGDFNTLTAGNNIVEGCEIYDFGTYLKTYHGAVMTQGVGNVITHNKIYDGPHGGIYVLGNDHIISYNDISDVTKQFLDMGAIYINNMGNPWERNITVNNNYFHNIGEDSQGVNAVYYDFNGDGMTVENNIFYKIGKSGSNQVFAIYGGGNYLKIRNNIFAECAATFYNGSAKYNATTIRDPNVEGSNAKKFLPAFEKYSYFKNEPFISKYPELSLWYEEKPFDSQKNEFSNNVILNTNTTLSQNGSTGFLGDPLLVKSEHNYITNIDPGFIDINNGNFSVKPDSEIYKVIPNFKNIER